MGETCSRCGGTGYLEVDDLHVRQCVCSYARDMKAHLGEVAGATVIYESPLFVPGGDDLTKKCLYIKGAWRSVAAHLKWVLFWKGLRYKYRIVTDEKLKTVYLGAEAYTAKARGKRDDEENYNSLGDLIGEKYDLVVIRLGCLGYKNIAAPGILKEALLLRDTMGKTTWLVEDPSTPWEHSYNQEVGEYVLENFQVVAIGKAQATEPVAPGTVRSGDVGLDETEIGVRSGSSPIASPVIPEDTTETTIVMDAPPKRKRGRGNRGGSSSSGGLDETKLY